MTRPPIERASSKPGESSEAGVALVEMTLLVPVFLFVMLIGLEFGLAFKDELTLSQATREGARTGSGLAAAGVASCAGGDDPEGVDAQIVAAVQGVLASPGSAVNLADISEIRIYKSDSAGSHVGAPANVWHYEPGWGPDMDPGTGVDRLDFKAISVGWRACERVNSGSPDSIGVRIGYDYQLKTPLASFSRYLGGSQAFAIGMPNHTVMALNPSG